MGHLSEGITPTGSYSKLKDGKIGPENQSQISHNTYSLDLPAHLQISPTCNVADIYEYHPPDDVIECKSSRVKTSPKEGPGASTQACYYLLHCFLILVAVLCCF